MLAQNSDQMSSKNECTICAVIVSYNIGKDICKCLNSVINQVDKVIIVDNASSNNTLSSLKEIETKFKKVKIIKNKKNFGIGIALNKGAEYAIKNSYKWMLTLDHDSEVGNEMIQKMLKAYNSLPDKIKKNIAIIAPNYSTIKGPVYKRKSPFIIPTTITSGQLVKTNIFYKIGFYKEDLFIECVDHEFCLRALRHGLKLLLVPNTFLKQRIGLPELHKLFGKKFIVGNHLPERYYYIYRNSLYIYKNYFLVAPWWISKNIISNIIILFKILAFENNKFKKLFMIIIGFIDGIVNKYGKVF